MDQSLVLYEKYLNRVNGFLKVSGSYFDEKDIKRTILERFYNHPFYCFNIAWIVSHVVGEFAWLFDNYTTASMVKLTYLIPCVTLSLLGCSKSYFLIRHGDKVNDLITSIKTMMGKSSRYDSRSELDEEFKKRMAYLKAIINANVCLYASGLTIFAIGPVIMSLILYKATGKLIMQLPFLSNYPFDETDIRYWPLAYIHQVWAGFIATSTVHGPDSFYAVSCTFLQIQFKTINYDIERIIPAAGDDQKYSSYDEFKYRFVEIIGRHIELFRCVNIIETIYSKSTLCNVAVSSVVICVSAFNITTIDEFMLMTPFIAFLIMWLLQVFVLCYYSDLLIQSSTEVSDAIFNSLWYKADATIMKDLLFVLTRSQKPCKLTAMGFTDLNLRVFNKIVSNSWSFFALLQSVYNK